jgi:polar amino acid transport system substrate-binding protein
MRYLQVLILTCLLSLPAAGQSASEILAPTGTLRAIFLGSNPVQGRIDLQTGVSSGPVPDLVQELARRLGVPYKIVSAPAAGGVIDALRNHTADIGFLAYDETRAREVDFGGAFIVMFNSYLVRSNSSIQKTADIDVPAVTVAAVRGQTQELFVSSHLKKARTCVRSYAAATAIGNLIDERRSGRVCNQPPACSRGASRVGFQAPSASRQFFGSRTILCGR